MKNPFLLLLLIVSFLASCNKDDDDEHQEHNEETEVEVVAYNDYEVDFFTSHAGFEVVDNVFETVTEQVLVKSAYQEGATFETVTEIVLVQAAYKKLKIEDNQEIYIVANAETNTIQMLPCYDFFEQADFETTEIPAEYRTISREIVVQAGTGDTVPPEYAVITKEVLKSLTKIIPITESAERETTRVSFRIPNEMTIQAYLTDQFSQQDITDCIEGNAYRIVD